MGWTGNSVVTGWFEYPARPVTEAFSQTTLEQCAEMAAGALANAGLTLDQVDGLMVTHVQESEQFIPATVSEYLGTNLNFAELIDYGGASGAAMVLRAAMAVELGIAKAVLCICPGGYGAVDPRVDYAASMHEHRFGAASNLYGSPQAEFEIPYGLVAQNAGYAMIAQRYAAVHGYDEEALAKLVVSQRENAQYNPAAVFYGEPLTIDEVMNSRPVAPPIKLLEVVKPVFGGAALLVCDASLANNAVNRPVAVRGAAEALSVKSAWFAKDMLVSPLQRASAKAFAQSGFTPEQMDCVQLYDCYSITVALSLEAAGFCAPGGSMAFLRERDLRWNGDFPLNTHGGQLGFGQPGRAGGMTQVIEALRQLQGIAEGRQVKDARRAFVSGTGGILSEQIALVLEAVQ